MHTPGTIRRAGAAAAAVAIALAVAVSLQANAQPAYPAKAIHLSVPFPSGGASDASARMVAEQLSKRLVVVSWIGLVGPGRMPKGIIDRLNEELNAALAGSELKDKIAGLGVRATPGSAEAFRDEIRRDLERNGPIIKAARITVE